MTQNNSRFEITITEYREVVKTFGKEYGVIGEKEIEREDRFFRNSDSSEPRTRIEKVYGYTPEIEKRQTETRELLKQTVDTLDLSAVIKAINGL